jgi:hypothetical protein
LYILLTLLHLLPIPDELEIIFFELLAGMSEFDDLFLFLLQVLLLVLHLVSASGDLLSQMLQF